MTIWWIPSAQMVYRAKGAKVAAKSKGYHLKAFRGAKNLKLEGCRFAAGRQPRRKSNTREDKHTSNTTQKKENKAVVNMIGRTPVLGSQLERQGTGWNPPPTLSPRVQVPSNISKPILGGFLLGRNRWVCLIFRGPTERMVSSRFPFATNPKRVQSLKQRPQFA